MRKGNRETCIGCKQRFGFWRFLDVFLGPNMVKGLKKATVLVFDKNLTYEYCNLHECGEKGCLILDYQIPWLVSILQIIRI